MKYIWTAAYLMVEPLTSAAYWLASTMHTLEIYLATKAGEPRDE